MKNILENGEADPGRGQLFLDVLVSRLILSLSLFGDLRLFISQMTAVALRVVKLQHSTDQSSPT